MGAAVAGMIADSFLGAWLERRKMLNNDLVNFLGTMVAAGIAFWWCESPWKERRFQRRVYQPHHIRGPEGPLLHGGSNKIFSAKLRWNRGLANAARHGTPGYHQINFSLPRLDSQGRSRPTKGTIIRMPHQLGLPRASATAIQTRIAITMFTTGMKNRRIHHRGFLATINIKMILAMGIRAARVFRVRLGGDGLQG